jgi:hypothetical protein
MVSWGSGSRTVICVFYVICICNPCVLVAELWKCSDRVICLWILCYICMCSLCALKNWERCSGGVLGCSDGCRCVLEVC